MSHLQVLESNSVLPNTIIAVVRDEKAKRLQCAYESKALSVRLVAKGAVI